MKRRKKKKNLKAETCNFRNIAYRLLRVLSYFSSHGSIFAHTLALTHSPPYIFKHVYRKVPGSYHRWT